MTTCRPVIVLGAERSGTSACAEMVHRWGAYAGQPKERPEPDELNPRGRWEYLPLLDLHTELRVHTPQQTWWAIGFDNQMADLAHSERFSAWARALIAKMERPRRPWMWKEPSFAHFLPFWQTFWRDPLYVIVIRHPVDVALSWQTFVDGFFRRTPTSLSCNLLRWQRMNLTILRDTARSPRIFLEYERLVSEPQQQAAVLAGFLNASCGTESDDLTLRRMSRACDPALWRTNHRTTPASQVALGNSQAALYQFLRALVSNPILEFHPDDFSMPSGWQGQVIAEERESGLYGDLPEVNR
jgi:hypothetical protein